MSPEVEVARLLAENGAPPAPLDLPLFSSGRLSSIQFLELVLHVEAAVGALDEADVTLENFDTLGAIEALIARHRPSERAGAAAP